MGCYNWLQLLIDYYIRECYLFEVLLTKQKVSIHCCVYHNYEVVNLLIQLLM